MYYWVNQGKTYFQESGGGYLWAPIKDINGRSLFHWDNMKKLMPNDLIFNYKKGYLVGYCIVKSKVISIPSQKVLKWILIGKMKD